MKKTYTGIISGVKALANGKYLLFVETERHSVNEGVGFDVVYANSYLPLLSSVSYKIIHSRKGYICIV